MKLELSGNEVESILLEWAKTKFPGSAFAEVEFDSGYKKLNGAIISEAQTKARPEYVEPVAPFGGDALMADEPL